MIFHWQFIILKTRNICCKLTIFINYQTLNMPIMYLVHANLCNIFGPCNLIRGLNTIFFLLSLICYVALLLLSFNICLLAISWVEWVAFWEARLALYVNTWRFFSVQHQMHFMNHELLLIMMTLVDSNFLHRLVFKKHEWLLILMPYIGTSFQHQLHLKFY